MAIKTTRAEFLAFFDDPHFWPQGAWYEGEEVRLNGDLVDVVSKDEGSPTDAISLSGGMVYKDGGWEWCSLDLHFLRWRRKVNVPNGV